MDDKPHSYKPLRRDLFDRLHALFSPARPQAAHLAAIRVAESLTQEQRMAYARTAEADMRKERSERAKALFHKLDEQAAFKRGFKLVPLELPAEPPQADRPLTPSKPSTPIFTRRVP